MKQSFRSKLVAALFAVLPGLAWTAIASASNGSLQLDASHVVQLSKSDNMATSCAAKDGSEALPVKLVWNNLILRRGKQQAGVPVDLAIDFKPVFNARAGDIIMNVIDVLGGKLTVDPKGLAENWTILPGNYSNQSAKSNFDTVTGKLHLALPIILDNGAGIRAGTHMVAICSQAQSDWQCNEGHVVFEERRRANVPNAEIDNVIQRWIPAPAKEISKITNADSKIGPVSDCCLSGWRCKCTTCSASTEPGIPDAGCKLLCPNCNLEACDDCQLIKCPSCGPF